MIWTLLAAAAESLAAATGMSAAAATFAVNFAVSYVVTRIFTDNPEKQQDMGVRQQVPPSGVNAIPIAYGDVAMGGTFIDAVLSTDQKCMYYVLAISGISPNGQVTFNMSEMYYGDRLITFGETDHARVVSLTDTAGNVDDKISGCLYIGLYTSNSAGVITPVNWYAPNVVMAETFSGFSIPASQVWPATGRQMYNTAFAIVRLEYSREADTTQLQPITFKLKHALNGTGVAKPGDVWNDYITNIAYGGAVDADFVDSASATALNTYSDELITFTDSDGNPATQPRYRINGVLDAGQSVLSNIDRILSSCDSWMAYNAALGQWSVIVNKAENVTYAFDDDNIIGDIRVSATDLTSSINQIEARFPFKKNRDQAAYVNIQTPSWLLYPNEPVNKYSITYDLVNDSVQAHYLANRLLEQAREDLIVSFSTTYYGIQVNAGDVVSVTNADYGWNAKKFRVMKVNEASLPNGGLGARLEMNEYNAQVYDDKDITEFTPVPNSDLPSVSYFSALSAPIVTGYPTATLPHFDVQVLVPTTGRTTFITLYFTSVATPTASDWQQLSIASTSNSIPITNGTYYTFTNLVLNTGTYYFAYLVGNDIGRSVLSPKSTAFDWSPSSSAVPFVDISGFTSFSKSTSGTFTPASTVLNALIENITAPTYSWVVTGATPTTGALSSITITPTSSATSVEVTLTVDGSNLTAPISRSITMAIIEQGTPGTNGSQFATANLYQWNTGTPGNPSGSSTYTWATGASSSYTGGNGWAVTPGSNPGTPLARLYVASKQVSAAAGVATSTVSWTSGYSIVDASQNGANGVQNARPTVYQWAITIPSISGSSTYTWSSGTFTPNPSGWSNSITSAPSAGYTLWAASVQLTDSATTTTSTINWTTASIISAGYSGTNGTNGSPGATGASARIMYARIASNPTPVAGTVTVSGDNRPTGAQASAVWGSSFNVTWYASDPDPSSNNSLYQADGVYNGSSSTSWSAPYISSLKVGSLSAVSTNTGNLTVTGTFQSNTAAISGTTMTGSGGVLYASGSFAYGNSTGNITYNGSTMTLNGKIVACGNISGGTISGTGWAGSTTIGGFFLPALLVNRDSAQTLFAALQVYETGTGATDSTATLVKFQSDSPTNITMEVTTTASGAGAAKFFNTGSSKQGWVAPGLYSFYSPAGGGQIKITDGTAPFTGIHEGMLPLAATVEVGDIVVDSSIFYRRDISNCLFNVVQSTTANQVALGVLNTVTPIAQMTPSALWESYTYIVDLGNGETELANGLRLIPPYTVDGLNSEYKVAAINALGEGQINVCGENGDIAVGDLIVTSNMAGKGMKQADDLIHSYTVAKAREAVTFSNPTDVQMIACIYVSG